MIKKYKNKYTRNEEEKPERLVQIDSMMKNLICAQDIDCFCCSCNYICAMFFVVLALFHFSGSTEYALNVDLKDSDEVYTSNVSVPNTKLFVIELITIPQMLFVAYSFKGGHRAYEKFY